MGKTIGKKQTFESYGFLKYFGWGRNPCNSQNMGKVWENTQISHIIRHLADLGLMKTHAIPNVWECKNSHKKEILCGKQYDSQVVGF